MWGMYILDDQKNPVRCDSMEQWGDFIRVPDNKIVASSEFGDARVSTVFLGMDHSFGGGLPLLFETMIFGGKHDGYQERYHTWAEAEAGHDVACGIVNAEAIIREKKLKDLGI